MPRKPARYTRHKRRRKTTTLRKYFGTGVLFAGFLLFLSLYAFYKQFHQSYTSAASAISSDFKHKDFYTVALLYSEGTFNDAPLIINSIKILFLSTEHSIFSVYDMPTDLTFDMPGKFGEEQLSKSFALGTMVLFSSDDMYYETGINFTLNVLQNLIGAKIDRFVLVEPRTAKFAESLLIEGDAFALFHKSEIKNIKQSLKTNMSFTDLLHFYSLSTGFSKSEITFDTFESPDLLDTFIRETTYDSSFAEEKKSIAVLNGSGFSGLASFGARVVKNRGGHIVAVDNAKDIHEKSYLIVDDKTSETASYLLSFFEDAEIYSKDELNFDEPVLDRADVTLILGLDIASKY